MPVSRTRGPTPPADAHRHAARGEIEALLDSPELRRIFDGEPKMPAARFAPSAARRRREPAKRPEAIERPLADLRPRRRRRFRIAVGLVPLYLAGLIVIFEVAREPGPFFRMLGSAGAAEEPSRVDRGDAGALRVMAANTGPKLQRASTTATAAGKDRVESVSATTSVSAVPPPAEEFPSADLVAQAPEPESLPAEKTAADLAKNSALLDRESLASTPMDEAAVPEPSVSASSVAAAGWDAAYPDPREGLVTQVGVAGTDPEAAAAAERALDLSPAERREVQLRLRLADFDPELVDGIFGPDTRAALTAWQTSTGLPATGFLDEPSLAALAAQTDEEYRAWRVTERARIQREEAENAVTASSVPRARPVPTKAPQERCRRTQQGEIAFGQGMACDARAARENFRRDLHDLGKELGELLR